MKTSNNKEQDKSNTPDRDRPEPKPFDPFEEEAIIKGAQQEDQLDELKKNTEEKKDVLSSDDTSYVHYDPAQDSVINPNKP